MTSARPDGRGGDGNPTRRRLLAALGAGAAGVASAGCVGQARDTLDREPGRQISLTVKTLPADADARATAIAQALTARLRAVGVDAQVTTMARGELVRDVLVNHDFDLYVGQHPGALAPDFLRPLLHSRYTESSGWQNPFGFANPTVDDLLRRQRRLGGVERERVLTTLQETVARVQPFVTVAFPDAVRAAREDRFETWPGRDLQRPPGYFALAPRGSTREIRLARTDSSFTRDLNPLTAGFGPGAPVTDLLYEPLARRGGGETRPWLATGWEWERTGADPGPVARVRLRDGAAWHDGRHLTAADVAFTYRFLADTSLGRTESAVPSPRFQGRVALVESATAVDDATVRLAFDSCSTAVAERALTVPVLPRHVWRTLAGPAKVAGIDVAPYTTEALVWKNPDPVGSGPLAVARRIAGSELILERTGEHFLEEVGESFWFGPGAPAYDRLVLRVAPADTTAVALVDAGEVDATSSPVSPRAVPDIARAEGVALHVAPTRAFYHVGFNARHTPLENYQFRRAVARLVDKADVVNEVLGGYGSPAASPLAGTRHLPAGLSWSGDDPEVPFVGANGSLDVARAKRLFEEAGYRYGEDGVLLEK